MIRNYFKTAWRSIARQKMMSLINVIGLSVGMASAVLIGWWVQNELSYDTFHADADRIYRIKNHLKIDPNTTWAWENSPLNYGNVVKNEVPEVENFTLFRDMEEEGLVFNINNEYSTQTAVAFVDSMWFEMFEFPKLYGTLKGFGTNPSGVVISKDKARLFFGEENAVGKTFKIDSLSYVVQAVLDKLPTNSSFQNDVWLPLPAFLSSPDEYKNAQGWNNFDYITFLKLKPNAKKETVESKLSHILKKQKGEDSDMRSSLTALTDIHFDDEVQSSVFALGNPKILKIFSILGVLLLVVACINYINLTTAKASIRSKEVTVRKIVGADRGQLFKQFIVESFLMTMVALCLTVLLLVVALPWFNLLTVNHFSISLDSYVLWSILLGTVLITTLLNGIYPAVFLSSFKPLNVLRGQTVLGGNNSVFRRGLVVFQFAVVMVLITSTVIISSQMKFIQQSNVGYDKSQVLSFSIPNDAVFPRLMNKTLGSYLDAYKQEILLQNVVSSVSTGSGDVIDNRNRSSGGFYWEGKSDDFDPSFMKLSVDKDFTKMFNLELVEGDWFTDVKLSPRSYIINETAVKTLGLKQPIVGQKFAVSRDTGVIAGVVKDFYYKKMSEVIEPVVVYNSDWRSQFFVQLQQGKIADGIAAMEKLWKARFPTTPFEYRFLDESFDKLYKSDTQASQLVLVFSGIAILISALGLLGLAAFSAERRIKEIGIRKVLGASVPNLMGLLSKEFVYLVMVSILVASPLAWYLMNQWLQNFAYRIDIKVWYFALSAIIALGVAVITVGVQAMKTARANPVKSLRTE